MIVGMPSSCFTPQRQTRSNWARRVTTLPITASTIASIDTFLDRDATRGDEIPDGVSEAPKAAVTFICGSLELDSESDVFTLFEGLDLAS